MYFLAISSLLPADSPRLAGEDADHTLRLTETEARLPPILVHRSAMRVIDGMHRLRAAMLKGQRDIQVTFFDGNDAEAFARGVEANIAHGLPLSRADRRAAAARIMDSDPQLSDRVIAARTGLSAKTVGSIRRSTGHGTQSNGRVGADGRMRPLNGAEGRRLAAEAIAARPDAPLREIAKAAGVALSTAHDVRRRLNQGQDPIPPGSSPGGSTASSTPARTVSGGVASAVWGPRQEGAPGPRRQIRDRIAILQKLMKDPSLRHTDPGRKLLRLLHSRVITAKDGSELLDSLPEHCKESVAELARQCAWTWQQLAEELERR